MLPTVDSGGFDGQLRAGQRRSSQLRASCVGTRGCWRSRPAQVARRQHSGDGQRAGADLSGERPHATLATFAGSRATSAAPARTGKLDQTWQAALAARALILSLAGAIESERRRERALDKLAARVGEQEEQPWRPL